MRFEASLPDRFDRQVCYRQCRANDAHHADLPLVDVCGKCRCEVPWNYGIRRRGDLLPQEQD